MKPAYFVRLSNGDSNFQPAVAYDSGGLGPIRFAVADVKRGWKARPRCGEPLHQQQR
jgi:hypothetical protein